MVADVVVEVVGVACCWRRCCALVDGVARRCCLLRVVVVRACCCVSVVVCWCGLVSFHVVRGVGCCCCVSLLARGLFFVGVCWLLVVAAVID